MSTTHESTDAVAVTVTDEALEQVKQSMAAENVSHETGGLRVSVLPGGCSGFQYGLNIEEAPLADDHVVTRGEIRLFVDEFSAQYLSGIEIGYRSSMQESGFTFNNPNATGGCGCGSSFSV